MKFLKNPNQNLAENYAKLPPCSGALVPFLGVLSILVLVYAIWLITFWPGVLGEDSLAILLEVQTRGDFQSGKPAFWYFFVKTFFMPGALIEGPIGFQLLLSAIIFSRILSWCWAYGLKKIFVFLLIFICLAPHMIFFMGSLYPDGIFSVAVAGLLFELWLITKTRQVSLASLGILLIAFPIAVFARTNGAVFLLAVIYVAAILPRNDRIKILAVGLVWCALVVMGDKMHKTYSHGAIYPLVVFETANFLQPRPMNLWREKPRVSEKTIQTLTKYQPLEKIIQNYDRDYWDPLQYHPDGPKLGNIDCKDQKIIVKEFFRHNLWQNIPAFVSSRVNVFMVAALAQGGMVSIDYASQVIPKIKTLSIFRYFQWNALESRLKSVHAFSEKYRWLLWTPFLGMVLLFMMLRRAYHVRSPEMLVVALPMGIQLVAIFVFSIAGEYRYLLPFFTLPLVALPALAVAARER